MSSSTGRSSRSISESAPSCLSIVTLGLTKDKTYSELQQNNRHRHSNSLGRRFLFLLHIHPFARLHDWQSGSSQAYPDKHVLHRYLPKLARSEIPCTSRRYLVYLGPVEVYGQVSGRLGSPLARHQRTRLQHGSLHATHGAWRQQLAIFDLRPACL